MCRSGINILNHFAILRFSSVDYQGTPSKWIKPHKVKLVVVRVLLLLLAVLLYKMCTKTRKSVLFVVSKSHRTVVWLWVQVTMVIHDFRDARMQLSLCYPWLLFTFTTDGHANQTVISVCLLPLHFQHILVWMSLITFPLETNARDTTAIPPNSSPVTPVAMFLTVTAPQQCRLW